MKTGHKLTPLIAVMAATGLYSTNLFAGIVGSSVTAPTSSAINIGVVSDKTGALDTLGKLPTKKTGF